MNHIKNEDYLPLFEDTLSESLLTKDNIELVPLTEKYVKGFYNLTKEYRKEHEERMKNER